MLSFLVSSKDGLNTCCDFLIPFAVILTYLATSPCLGSRTSFLYVCSQITYRGHRASPAISRVIHIRRDRFSHSWSSGRRKWTFTYFPTMLCSNLNGNYRRWLMTSGHDLCFLQERKTSVRCVYLNGNIDQVSYFKQ